MKKKDSQTIFVSNPSAPGLANVVCGSRQRGDDAASMINCGLLSWEGETHDLICSVFHPVLSVEILGCLET